MAVFNTLTFYSVETEITGYKIRNRLVIKNKNNVYFFTIKFYTVKIENFKTPGLSYGMAIGQYVFFIMIVKQHVLDCLLHM